MQMNESRRWLVVAAYAAAMAWVLFLFVFGLTIVQLKLQDRWVYYEEG